MNCKLRDDCGAWDKLPEECKLCLEELEAKLIEAKAENEKLKNDKDYLLKLIYDMKLAFISGPLLQDDLDKLFNEILSKINKIKEAR